MNIIAQLQGGLGNQLFQYASARALALSANALLKLDIAWFNNNHHDVSTRNFELLELNIDVQSLWDAPIRKQPNRAGRIAQDLLPINPYIYRESKPYRFDSKLLLLPKKLYRNQDLYLLGYWQSYKYFSEIKDLLIEELRPRAELSICYKNLLGEIETQTSAMVHIRRGDYVHLKSAAKVHGFLGLEYYKSGMQALVERNPGIHFFVFSDDIVWAKSHLPFQHMITYIEVPIDEISTSQELFLMTQCDYHLIANSSLSWWGAWLAHGENMHRRVWAPRFWTNDRQANWQDLIPNSWGRI